jgi:hypothetical protein
MEREIIKKHILELEIGRQLCYVHRPYIIKRISKIQLELISDYSDEPEIFDDIELILDKIKQL